MKRGHWIAALALSTLVAGGCADCPDGGALSGEANKEQWCQKVGPSGAVKHGPYRKWHASGKLFVEGAYRDGAPDGRWQYFGEDGKKLGECTLTDRTGTWSSWLPGGQSWETGDYYQGQKVGQWQSWWRNGKKNKDEQYKDGKLHGRSKVWHESGQLFFDGQYREGEKCGTWTYHLAETSKTEEHPPCK